VPVLAVIEMRLTRSRPARLFGSAALIVVVAAATAGCQTTQSNESTSSLPIATPDHADADPRRVVEIYGQQYRANSSNVDIALRYAQGLRAAGQRAQAVAVLEKASIESPHDKAVLGAYGRALAETGYFDQALDVLDRAHTPDQPDWHILSAQGAVLDQMDRHAEAQRHYVTALKIVPEESSVLSNLGLSYALSKNLPEAEATLRRAAAHPPVDPRVRQNLALVVGLRGRFAEAETIARADLPPDQAAANVAYLRQMLARGKNLHEPNRDAKTAAGASRSATVARREAAANLAPSRESPPDQESQ
jgi:Flp pilus assembly protein TadD